MQREFRPPTPSTTAAILDSAMVSPADGPRTWLVDMRAATALGMRRHGVPLALLLLVCGVVQFVILHASFQPGYFPDSREYVGALDHITRGSLFDPKRPPGYPLFLLVVFTFAGWGNLLAVVYAQAVLMVITVIEIYLLGYLLTQRRWLGVAAALAVGVNIELINWERAILSEAFALWASVTLVLLLTRFLQTRRRGVLVAFAGMAVLAILVRPAFLLLPLLLMLLKGARAVWLREVRVRWRSVLGSVVAIYSCIGLYICGNAVAYGYPGFTDVADVNLFGKVLEYRLWNNTSDPASQGLRQDIIAYVHGNPAIEPWGFPASFPDKGYDAHFYAALGAFSHAVIMRDPVGYVARSWSDMWVTLTAPPGDLVPISARSWVMHHWLTTDAHELAGAYLALLPMAMGLLVLVVRFPRRLDLFLLLCLALVALMNVVLVGLTVYNSFYRVRSPLDWAAIFVAVVAVGLAGEWLVRRIRLRGTAAPESA